MLSESENSLKAVYVAIQFDKFGQIDTLNETFQADVMIIASWEDDKIGGNYDEFVDWNPNLYIENSIQERKKSQQFKLEKLNEKNTTKITQIIQISG